MMYWSFATIANTKKVTKMENNSLFLMMDTSKIVVDKNKAYAKQTKARYIMEKLNSIFFINEILT